MDKSNILKGKKIVLGVTGGIAAYKSVYLLRLLVQRGASVQVVGTMNSLNFIGRATWESLSGRMPLFDTFENSDSSKISHIILAQEVDAIIIAPATGNILGKAANGIADDLLSTILMAATVPVVFAPGMNTAMYENPATVNNIVTLGKRNNVFFVEPGRGPLACGTSGKGRMAEPENIISKLEDILSPCGHSGIKWLVTGGATREFIDPVRFITNGSSGRTGVAIAEAALKSGGDVTFIGVNVEIPVSRGIKKIATVTSAETHKEVIDLVKEADIFVMSAAVADYKPEKSISKIKKNEGGLVIELSRTEDILVSTADMMKPGSVRIGFAAETENLEENAVLKLRKKKLDMVVANLVSEKFDPFRFSRRTV
jgi:phosphopantothenoylcysteine decarboxylase / phosphopantothenate---cysteine ligase